MIYGIHESILNIFKNKSNSSEDRRIDRACEDKVKEILDKHKARHRSIINNTLSKYPDISDMIEFDDEPPLTFGGRYSKKRISGNVFICTLDVVDCNYTDKEWNKLYKFIRECVKKLNDYNKSQNIDFISYSIAEDDLTVGYDIDF